MGTLKGHEGFHNEAAIHSIGLGIRSHGLVITCNSQRLIIRSPALVIRDKFILSKLYE